MKCCSRILNITFRDHITNDTVKRRIKETIGLKDDLLTQVKKRKLRWYGHVSRGEGLATTILQGTVPGGRRPGRQQKRWEDNIEEWTNMKFAQTQRLSKDRHYPSTYICTYLQP